MILNFLRNLYFDFQSGCISCPPVSIGGAFPLLYSLQRKLSLLFLILAILTGVRWNLRFVWIHVTLVAKDAEHFFVYFGHLR